MKGVVEIVDCLIQKESKRDPDYLYDTRILLFVWNPY